MRSNWASPSWTAQARGGRIMFADSVRPQVAFGASAAVIALLVGTRHLGLPSLQHQGFFPLLASHSLSLHRKTSARWHSLVVETAEIAAASPEQGDQISGKHRREQHGGDASEECDGVRSPSNFDADLPKMGCNADEAVEQAGMMSDESYSSSGDSETTATGMHASSFVQMEDAEECASPPTGHEERGLLTVQMLHHISRLAANWTHGVARGVGRRKSAKPECQATTGPREDPEFLQHFRPCGTLSAICTDLPLVEANKDYPGGGVAGALIPDQDYVVQFDVGLHPAVARDVLKRHLNEIDTCINCPDYNETCLETIVTGGAMWGDLGLSTINPREYNCMGGCGPGCASSPLLKGRYDAGALDCLKHDLCSAWKSLQLGRSTRGFCHDPDCGDEAAMTIFNCWKGWRLFGSVGGSGTGPFSEPAICDPADPGILGCWSHSGWFTSGRCKVFQGKRKGQGIPDPLWYRSPIQRL